MGVIEPNLRRAEIERARRKRPDSLGAYDLYLRALPHFASDMPEDAKIGMEFLEQALGIDQITPPLMLIWRGGWKCALSAAVLMRPMSRRAYGMRARR